MRACCVTSCLLRQDFESGCLQKQVFVSGWEMVPSVHRLMEVGHATSYTVHREYGLAAPLLASAKELLVALVQITHPQLFFLTLEDTYTVVNPTLLFVVDVFEHT